ncbi:MAG: hypothetical protein GX847_08300 [Clostridiales bacterium]|nr:hypothetical protein [Clostridiales bacterium]
MISNPRGTVPSHQKHTADPQSDIERLGIVHFRTSFAGDMKADNSINSQNNEKLADQRLVLFMYFLKAGS